MCGIMGYVGCRETVKVILDGLAKHEYRGYDSAGIAVINDGKISSLRTAGRVARLAALVREHGFSGEIGIGHTRWATHGGVTESNAHPHTSFDNRVALVHNGIIENAHDIRAELEAEGIEFRSDTDTESAVQYLARCYRGDPKAALTELTARIEGSFALVILFYDRPNEIWAARKGSPLVVGAGRGEGFCASDPTALLSYTRDVWFMDDGELALITAEGCRFYDFEGREHDKKFTHLDWSETMADKGKYPHFMLKEVFEQPEVMTRTLLGHTDGGRVDLSGELGWTPEEAKSWKRIHFIACGTSHYATMVAVRLMERISDIAMITEVASEYRYRNIRTGPDTLTVFVSQSGETADTLQAARLAKERGSKCVVITNVRSSTMHREIGDALITPAGPEIGVAATKTFMAQITMLTLLGLYILKLRGELPESEEHRIIGGLSELPEKLAALLEQKDHIAKIAAEFAESKGFFFIGRGLAYPPALEGALKLKEISYKLAEAYPAGEMKHGPIALLDQKLPVVALIPKDSLWEKAISNIEESVARKAPVIAIATEGDTEIGRFSDHVIYTPKTEPELFPFIAAIPLQLFAYHVALTLGCDIDKPRNLAKSVTVE